MRKMLLFLLIVGSLLVTGITHAEEIYYVQSLKAKIMSTPSFKAKTIGESSRGTKLVSSGREGRWIRVMLPPKEGYVSSLLLSKFPPLNKTTLIKGDETAIKHSVRRRASTYTSAAAARGLAQDDRRRLSRDEKVDYGGVEKMESFTVGNEELSRFMEGSAL